MIEIFNIVSGKIVINKECLLIPEFKAITEKYPEDKVNALTFVWYSVDPAYKYENYPEDRKSELLYKDYPGKYKPDEQLIIDAIIRLKAGFMELPEDRLYKGAKVATDNLATYLTDKSANITASKEAKLLMDTLKNVSAVAASLGDTREKRDTARLQMKAKGNAKIAYDQ